MVSHKQLLKELRSPDLFQKRMAQFVYKAERYRVHILAGVLGVLLIVGIGFTVSYWSKHRAEARRDELVLVDEVFELESKSAMDKQTEFHNKIEKLQKSIKELEGKKDKSDELAKLVQEKEALEKISENAKPEYKESLDKYLQFYKKYPSEKEGWHAAMNVATIWIQNEKYKEAADLLGEMLGKVAKVAFYDIQVRTLYVSLLEELGQFDLALEQAEILLKRADEALKPKILLSQGRILMLQGKKDKAIETLNKIISDNKDAQSTQKAKAYQYLWR